MNNIPQTFSDHFNKIYKQTKYLDKYGGSVVATTLTILFFFLLFSYYYIQRKIEPIKQDWANQRCSPPVMAFAGIINKPPNKSALEFTSENFVHCTTHILSSIVSYFVTPFYFISKIFTLFMLAMEKIVNGIRTLLFYLRSQLMKIFSYMVVRIFNVVIPLQRILIKIKDSMAKTIGVATAALYTVYGAYLGVRAFVGAFLEICILALIVLVALIILLWILPFTWPMAAAGTVFFLAVSVLIIIIAVWTQEILNIASRKVPGKPSCFDKNTLIETNKGKIKIKNLKPGDILANGDKITAVFKLAYKNLDIYKLNDIIVTGCHKVFHCNLGWIDVKDHPLSEKINDYREPYIYCLNTQSKRLTINNTKFLDWDDLEPFDIIKLKNLKYLTKNSPMSDIHKYLESGLDGNILIELENGQSVKLKNIKVNDQLYSGERITGCVKIDTKDIAFVKKYKFKNLEIIGGPNLHFKDNDLGIFNTLNLDGVEIEKPKYLYHLLTDTGFFNINGFMIRDYNSAIENILDIRNELLSLF